MARSNRVSLTDGLSPAVAKANQKKDTSTAESEKTQRRTPEVKQSEPVRPEASKTQDTSKTDDTRAREKAKRQERATQDDRVNLGVYLTAETYDDMKAAYLADWTNRRGDADTLYQWVADALAAHARRSATQRGKAPEPQKRATTRTGNTRAFKVPADVYQRMQDAIAADERAGRWLSESAWSVEAITAAIEAARIANGGTLPEPPARLPNRLKRRD